ncbi:MAG: hypothetical protein ACN6PR_00020 [Achromobacter sp.]
MTDQITAAQQADQEIEATMEQAQVFASAWAFLGGPFDNGSGLEQAERERSNLRALLSKLRAEGVQAGDERAAFKKCHSAIVKAIASIAMADGPDTRKANDPELLYRSPVMDDVVRIRVALDECSAALASAPVAGEAIYQIRRLGSEDWKDVSQAKYAQERKNSIRGVGKRWQRRIVYAAPQASEAVRILFPAHLRKLWSGGEVQAWLDEHQGITAPKASVKGSLERYRKWQAEQPQAGKASAPCSCPSGGGSLRWPCAVHPPRGRPTQPSKDGGGDE